MSHCQLSCHIRHVQQSIMARPHWRRSRQFVAVDFLSSETFCHQQAPTTQSRRQLFDFNFDDSVNGT